MITTYRLSGKNKNVEQNAQKPERLAHDRQSSSGQNRSKRSRLPAGEALGPVLGHLVRDSAELRRHNTRVRNGRGMLCDRSGGTRNKRWESGLQGKLSCAKLGCLCRSAKPDSVFFLFIGS